VESHCNHSGRKLDPGGVRRYRGHRKKDKEVGERDRREFDEDNSKRGKRDVYCDKQIGKAVTVLNCMLKGSWEEVGSGGIRKKLKSEYAAYLESKYRRNDGSSI